MCSTVEIAAREQICDEKRREIQMLQYLRATSQEDHGRDHSADARTWHELRGIRRPQGARQLPGRSVILTFILVKKLKLEASLRNDSLIERLIRDK